MPTSTEPDTGAIHRVLLDSGADPKLIHPAIEEIRHLSGQNVITAIGAQITEAPLRDASSDRRVAVRNASSDHRAPGGDEYPEH